MGPPGPPGLPGPPGKPVSISPGLVIFESQMTLLHN